MMTPGVAIITTYLAPGLGRAARGLRLSCVHGSTGATVLDVPCTLSVECACERCVVKTVLALHHGLEWDQCRCTAPLWREAFGREFPDTGGWCVGSMVDSGSWEDVERMPPLP